ncbi:hypothetical protein [uncultured Treponema sp.]|uniref:hypothetical protein n=1 Tax=uncultured Treponema sp. TaxID=162155 RepID=UPI0025949D0B|nr:hypothetical protein [uncultured Treponema sp.]
MNEIDFLAEEIFLRYGNVKRARGPFLYTEKGKRLTDLYQENGRAILGWGGSSAFTMLKNAIDRGATGSFKTCFSGRLEKSVNALFFGCERKVFIFAKKSDCLSTAVKISPQNTFVWKPWSEVAFENDNADCIIFEPPLPWTSGIYILAVKTDLAEKIPQDVLKETVKLSSPIEAAVTRSIYNLISALQIRQEKDWFIYDLALTKYWQRKGPYLFPKISKELYGKFILHCLDLGIVVSPIYEQPSIVPFGADRGVFEILKKNPFVF